jgi:hypothetical protein
MAGGIWTPYTPAIACPLDCLLVVPWWSGVLNYCPAALAGRLDVADRGVSKRSTLCYVTVGFATFIQCTKCISGYYMHSEDLQSFKILCEGYKAEIGRLITEDKTTHITYNFS